MLPVIYRYIPTMDDTLQLLTFSSPFGEAVNEEIVSSSPKMDIIVRTRSSEQCCGRTFNRPADLNRHRDERHNKGKIFLCPFQIVNGA